MITILTATKEEYELAQKNFPNYLVIRTGVGASNVIKTISALPEEILSGHFINIGFCGSNKLPVGTVTKVSRSYRLVDKNVEFEDYRNGYDFASLEGHDCYTSNSFVTESTVDDPVIYDMELNYIVAFPIDIIGSVKIVSDNLDVCEYEKTIDTTSPEVWREVRKCVEEISSIRK